MNDEANTKTKPRITGWQRVWIVVSAIWMLLNFMISNTSYGFNEKEYIIFGISPVVLGWVIWWIRRGFKK